MPKTMPQDPSWTRKTPRKQRIIGFVLEHPEFGDIRVFPGKGGHYRIEVQRPEGAEPLTDDQGRQIGAWLVAQLNQARATDVEDAEIVQDSAA